MTPSTYRVLCQPDFKSVPFSSNFKSASQAFSIITLYLILLILPHLELRFTKAAQQEQAKAVNRLLAKEVERLEQERLQLKKMLRKQAMHRGVRSE